MMQDFPLNPQINLSGVHQFEFTNSDSLATFPAVVGAMINLALDLKPGRQFYKGYSTLETMEFTEDSIESAQGTHYKQSLPGFTPGDSPELQNIFSMLERNRWIIKFTDKMGFKKIGGLYTPMSCQVKFSTGKKPGESRGYSFEFMAESVLRAPFITG